MRHAGVLVMSSEADIGRVSASELFSQQTCKWIPNGLFTYITLARAPLQGPGLLVLTGRPVNRPAGRPAKTIVLAGQKWPKLNISRNMHDFA